MVIGILTQCRLRYPEHVELGDPVAIGRRHGRRQQLDVLLLPWPALVRRRPVVAGRPGRAAHRLQIARHVPVPEPLVVQPTENGAVPHSVIVTPAQDSAARVTRETLHVVHEVLGPHHQVTSSDTALTPGAAFYREQPVEENTWVFRKSSYDYLLSYYYHTANRRPHCSAVIDTIYILGVYIYIYICIYRMICEAITQLHTFPLIDPNNYDTIEHQIWNTIAPRSLFTW